MTSDHQGNRNEGNIEATINAVTGLTKAVPVYQDAIQPAAKEIGKALETVAKTVNVALAPISVLVWGYDQIKDFVDNKVSEKLQNVPEDKIITPPTNIAGPALESLRYTGTIEELKDLYANLIASSMDSFTTENTHPSFVEIIKQLSPNEAKLLTAFLKKRTEPIITIRSNDNTGIGGYDEFRHFSILGEETKCGEHDIIPTYLDNLCRLGIIEIPENYHFITPGTYKHLEEHPFVLRIVNNIKILYKRTPKIIQKSILVTSFGTHFIETCVRDHRHISHSQ